MTRTKVALNANIVILGVIAFLITLVFALAVISTGPTADEFRTALVVLITGSVVPVLLNLYQAAQNGKKADEAVTTAAAAKVAATELSAKADGLHDLVNGDLLTKFRQAIAEAMLEQSDAMATQAIEDAHSSRIPPLPPSEVKS